MNILYLTHSVSRTGNFYRGFHLAKNLADLGHKTTLITTRKTGFCKTGQYEEGKVRIIEMPDALLGKARSGWDIWNVLNRIAWLRNRTFDIVHGCDSRPVVVHPALFAKRNCGAKFVLDWGDWWGKGGTIQERSNSFWERLFTPVETFYEEHFRKYADGNVVLTEALKRRAVSLGLKEETTIKMPHGADVENVVPRDKREARRRLHIADETRVLGYIGMIFPKDAELLAEAFRMVSRRLGDVRLFIIGNCGAKFPRELTNEGRITRTGRVDSDLFLDYLAACDVMLLPLRNNIANWGRWPSKICDYLSAGKPVVSTKVSDTCSLIGRHKLGRLADDTPVDFADKIIDLLQESSLAEYERNARRVAEKELSWRILSKRLEAFYAEILHK